MILGCLWLYSWSSIWNTPTGRTGWFVWEPIFRNTSSEFGKQRSNSLPGLPGIQHRLDGWMAGCVRDQDSTDFVEDFWGFAQGLDMAPFESIWSMFTMLFWNKTISRAPSMLNMTSLFRIQTVMINSPQPAAWFLRFDFRSSLSQVGMAMSSWEARVPTKSKFWSVEIVSWDMMIPSYSIYNWYLIYVRWWADVYLDRIIFTISFWFHILIISYFWP